MNACPWSVVRCKSDDNGCFWFVLGHLSSVEVEVAKKHGTQKNKEQLT